MKRSDEQPRDHKLRRFPEAFRRRRSDSTPQKQPTVCAVTIMPRVICCMEKTLYLNLPAGFTVVKNTRHACIFRGSNGLLLHISLTQTRLSLPTLTEYDFRLTLTNRMIPPVLRRQQRIEICTYRKGFLRHSPTLYMRYALTDIRQSRTEDFILYLMQWGSRLYTVSFSGLNDQNEHLAEQICTGISLKHHYEQTNIP